MTKPFICPYCEEKLPIQHLILRCPSCAEILPDNLRKEIDDYYLNYLEKQRNQEEVDTKKSQNKNINIIRIKDDNQISEKKEEISERQEINCPYCDELISSRAKKCKHCGEFLDKNVSNNSESKISDPNRDMSFWACVGRGFANLFNFKERSTRKEYWSYAIILGTILACLQSLIFSNLKYPTEGNIMAWMIIFQTLYAVLFLGIYVRRMRDATDNTFIHNVPFISYGCMFIGLVGGISIFWIIGLLFSLIGFVFTLIPSKK